MGSVYRGFYGRAALTLAWSGVLLLAFFATCCRIEAQSDLLQRWDLRYPTPPELGRIVFANGSFVALSPAGTGPPYISNDGVHWSHATVRFDSWTAGFSGVASGNDRFFGVNRAGQVSISTNAAEWRALATTPVSSVNNRRDIQIAAGNGVVVTTSAQGGASASADGRAWTAPVMFDACPKRLWYGNGTFLALLSCGETEPPRLVTSADGVAWTPAVDELTPPLLDVSFSDGVFTGVSSDYALWISIDGGNWLRLGPIPVQGNEPPTYVIHGGGKFVGYNPKPGADTVVLASPDGINWTGSTTVADVRGLVFGNGIFVISGSDIMTSPDGVSWTVYPRERDVLPTSVAYGAGRFVATGGKSLLLSTDGVRWEKVENADSRRVPVGLYYVNGLFVGPSWPSYDDKSNAVQGGFLLTSPDGINWTEHSGRLSSHRSGA